MIKKNVTITEYLRLKALGLNGLIESSSNPLIKQEELTFVNNINEIQRDTLQEYNVWYRGDGNGLLNYYTRANAIDFNTDPLYNRNKKSFFWAVSSTEGDTKRTHSGQPRNIVDTLVSIIGIPQASVQDSRAVLEPVDKRLRDILKDNDFKKLLTQRARPLTLVEGWGAWKINWDNKFRDTPILLYYRADSVDFIKRYGQTVAIVYRDYYQDEKKRNYVLFETRRIEKRKITEGPNAGLTLPCLIIEKELFQQSGQSEILIPKELKDLKQLSDTTPTVIIENFDRFLGCANVYYDDSSDDLPGRSIFTGKLALFDDLDQCLSQASNSVRRSTPTEVWDVNFLEKDSKTGMPKMPHAFDRKYVSYKGARGGDGSGNTNPVQTTQPSINFEQYSTQALQILLQIINGVMSPAALGIDLASKENGAAEREREKVTIFTRNIIINEETEILANLMQDLLCADELARTGKLTCKEYDVNVKYDKFADASFESTLETITAGYQAGLMDAELAIDMLYGDSISKEVRDRLLKHMSDMEEEEQNDPNMPFDEEQLGEMGAALGGNNNNPYNAAHKKISPDGVKEDMGIPHLGDYTATHDRERTSDVNKMLQEKEKAL